MTTQVVLITGALTGIGRATAIAFAKKGAKIVVSGRRGEAGKALAKELRSLGSEAEFINADVRKEDDVHALVDKTVARFGRLDVAVNNAGFEGKVGVIQNATIENFRAVHDPNVVCVFLSMKHELRVMAGQGSGSIVNITSTYGHKAAAGATAANAAGICFGSPCVHTRIAPFSRRSARSIQGARAGRPSIRTRGWSGE